MNHNLREGKEFSTVLGTGLIALDVVLSSKSSDPVFVGVGGTCGNVLTILSFLGWAAYPVARLNDSPASRKIKDDLLKWGVCLDFASTAPTGDSPVIIHTIKVNRSGVPYHRFSFNCPTCGAWLPNYKAVVDKSAKQVIETMEKPEVFFFDRASRASITLAKAVSAVGGVVIFEPVSSSNRRLFNEAVAVSHIVKYSDERFPESPVEESSEGSPHLEIQTKGMNGLKFRWNVRNRFEWRYLDAIRVNDVKDTAGSGDWCTAGLIHKLCSDGLAHFKRRSLAEVSAALEFGQKLSAWNCQFEGSRGGMYALDEKVCSDQFLSIYSDQNSKTFGHSRSYPASVTYNNNYNDCSDSVSEIQHPRNACCI